MEEIDIRPLYLLQDRVLKSVFSLDTGFYLTGGTCLHRFYHEDRYSVDLDLFTSDNTMFRQDVRKILGAFDNAGINHSLSVDSRDFVRIITEKELRVDMVNDRVFRAGQSIRLESGIMLDNIQNISANKICAVLGRDDPKDIFDLYAIYIRHAPGWPKILDYAARKCAFDPETLRFRLNSFPLELIDMVHAVNSDFVDRMKQEYDRMVQDIIG
jgi:predicted nucleotidyltransferase component of viral defense system